MTRPAYVEINVAAFKHNLARVRALAPQSKIMAMVKANAYGHGIAPLLAALQDADALGVCCLDEARTIRAHQFDLPVILLEGFFGGDELESIERFNLDTVIHSLEQIAILKKTKLNKPLNVWLKIDSGMNRLGLDPMEVKKAWEALQAIALVQKPVGLMTHFACADALQSPWTLAQMAVFDKTVRGLSGPHSLANSAGILAWPQSHRDWVRPGIMLYGISPFANRVGQDEELQPVMTLRAKLIAVRTCLPDEPIGYGATFTTPSAMRMGVVAMGYADGYPRHVPNGTPVLVNNQRVAIAGRVSMDMLTVDLRDCPSAKVGDPVVLWGKGLPIEEIATLAHTIPYELVVRINQRVHRVYV
jgi:alanine racemase